MRRRLFQRQLRILRVRKLFEEIRKTNKRREDVDDSFFVTLRQPRDSSEGGEGEEGSADTEMETKGEAEEEASPYRPRLELLNILQDGKIEFEGDGDEDDEGEEEEAMNSGNEQIRYYLHEIERLVEENYAEFQVSLFFMLWVLSKIIF